MNSAVMSPPAATTRPRRTEVRQLSSHGHLYDDPPFTLLSGSGRTRRDRPDAIVVPATRPASALELLIDIAANLRTELVVLCSGQAAVGQVAARMGRRVGARGIVARIDHGPEPFGAGLLTSSERFSVANGGRCSDLSTKRNVGLRLARIRDWSKIVFVDDDMTLDAMDVMRIVRLLDRFPIAGMRSLHYPDNSVLCHARRLAKLSQDVFVSGAVLGVNCAGRDLGFFPEVYNEDWFFFGEAAAAHRLPKPGLARQAPYNPFGGVDRARHEEFGDLLAEGLYSLIQSSGQDSFEKVVERATKPYWKDFIEVRQEGVQEVRTQLERFVDTANCGADVEQALASLEESARRYEGSPSAIDPDDCVAFLEAWRKDTADWRNGLPESSPRASTGEALTQLGIDHWVAVP